MSELDVFESQVREQIRQLDSPKASVRRKAAAWLGEAGDPSAIKRLTEIYQKDPNTSVRAAAAYSLGMFRALEGGMQSDDPDPVYELLEDIALRGKMGRRVPIATGCLGRAILGLLVSLALLLVFNFVIWPQYGPQIDGILVGETSGAALDAPDRASAIADLTALVDDIRNDTTTLQAQYADVSTLDCDTDFVGPIAYDVSGLDADIMTVGSNINAQIVQLAINRGPFNQACASDSPALTNDQVSTQLTALGTILETLPELEADLEGLPETAPLETATPDATTEVDATPVEDAPTEVVADPKSHLPALFASLDEIRSPSGAYALMATFWEGVSNNPVNSGCNNPVPPVPADYALPDVDASASSDLKLGVDLYNTGLALTRQGWDLIATACASGNLMDTREAGLMTTANANISFESAETLFTQMRDR